MSSISEAFGAQIPMSVQGELEKSSSWQPGRPHTGGEPHSFICPGVKEVPFYQPLDGDQLNLVGRSVIDCEEDEAEGTLAQRQQRMRRSEEADAKQKARHALMLPPPPRNRHPRITDTALIAQWNKQREWRYCPELVKERTKQLYERRKEKSRREIERLSRGGSPRHLKKPMIALRRRTKWDKEKDIWSTSAKVLVERAQEAGLNVNVPKGH